MNVSEQLLNILIAEGVQHIFGVAGDALNPLVNAIGKTDKIQWIRIKHEGNGSYAAFAQAALNGNFAVCASTVGPGALHLINGLYNAKRERSPVIAITGQVPVEHLGTNYHQEVDLKKVFDDVCDYQAIIRSAEEAPGIILRAIRKAVNDRCVCRIELPADIARYPAAHQDMVHRVYRSRVQIIPDMQEIEQAARLLREADTIGILAGAGCRNARAETIALAHQLKAPITHTLRAMDIFDHHADQVVGLTGLIGNPSGYKAVMDCDVLLMLGTDFPYKEFLPHSTKTIQVDIRPENIGNRTPVTCGIHGHILPVVRLLAEHTPEKKDSTFLKKLRKEFLDWKEEMWDDGSSDRDIQPIHPQAFARAMDAAAADDAIFVIDTGTATIWASNVMSFHKERRAIGSFNHGSMAVGLPAAIGAQLQYPHREVWALVGDGAFQMAMQDFTTAAEYKLPIKLLVLNNGQLGFVKIEMEEEGLVPNLDALHVEDFDMVAFAKSCGGDGIRVEAVERVEEAILKAKESDKPFIIDARVNSGELALPPKIGWKQVKGFGTSKVKEIIAAMQGDKAQWDNIKKQLEGYFD